MKSTSTKTTTTASVAAKKNKFAFDKELFKRSVLYNVKTLYRKDLEEATPQQIFQAVSYAIKDQIVDHWLKTQEAYEKQDPKTVYYLSMEFLMGRALGNSLINLKEYKEVADALEELGVNIIITDDDWYDYLKLFAAFFRLAGYAGMFIMIDELVNIYKIPNSITRQYNYEKMLTMYNDTLQGKAKYLGILMGATPQALEDRRRGIYSYEALHSRLSEGRFSRPGARDLLAPVIRLEPLTAEEMLVLCEKLAEMHAGLYGYPRSVTTEDLANFIKIEYGRIGADQNITPREVIRDFIELLDLLYQNPKLSITGLLSSDEFSYAKSEAVSDESDPGFAEFTI